MIKEIVVDKLGFKLFFVESVCDDPQIIEQNIMVSHSKFVLSTTLLNNGEKLKKLKKIMSPRVGRYYLLLQSKSADTVHILSVQDPKTGA
jgi:hypothetical protein